MEELIIDRAINEFTDLKSVYPKIKTIDVINLLKAIKQEQDKNKYKGLANLRDELYYQLPTGEVNAFDLIKIINNHIIKLNELI